MLDFAHKNASFQFKSEGFMIAQLIVFHEFSFNIPIVTNKIFSI